MLFSAEYLFQSVETDFQIDQRVAQMRVMLHQDPFVITAFLEQFRSFFPGFVAVAGAELAETETLTPDIEAEAGILDENILEMDRGDPVEIFVDGGEDIAAGAVQMADIQQQGSSGQSCMNLSSSS